MRDEYGPNFWKGAVRGKFADQPPDPDDPRLHLRLLDRDVSEVFPDSQAVNEALRTIMRLRSAFGEGQATGGDPGAKAEPA